MKQDRQEGGKFAPKSDEPREVRSIRLTDKVWESLGAAAQARRMTRADLIEEMVEEGQFELKPAGERNKELTAAVEQVLANPIVTRQGKDRGAVKRGLEALLKLLQ